MNRILLVLVAMSLTSCGLDQKQVSNGVEVSAGGSSGGIQEIKLSDGTRCAVLVGYNKAALTCNWK